MAAADVKAFITGYDIKLTKIPKKIKHKKKSNQTVLEMNF